MWRIYGGALMVIAGIAAFIEAHTNHPIGREVEVSPFNHEQVLRVLEPAYGWSRTTYDLVRIGAWALVILGALTVALGFVSYGRSTRSLS